MRPQPLIAVTDVEASSNGVLLCFEVQDIDALVKSATAMKGSMNVETILPRHQNPPNGDGGLNHLEI